MSQARELRDAFNNQLMTFEELLHKVEENAVYKKYRWYNVYAYRFVDDSRIQLEIGSKRISSISDAQEEAKQATERAEKRDKYTPISYAEQLVYSKEMGEITFDELLRLVEEQAVRTNPKGRSGNIGYTFDDTSSFSLNLNEKCILGYSVGDRAVVLKKRMAHPALNAWSTEILTTANVEHIFNKFYKGQKPESKLYTQEIYYRYDMEMGIYKDEHRIKASLRMTRSGDYNKWVKLTVLDFGAKLSDEQSAYLETIGSGHE